MARDVSAPAPPAATYRFGRFELRPLRRQLLDDGRSVALGQRAFDVLTLLVEGAGRLVTKDELLERVWPGLVVEDNNLQVQVSALRKLLGPGSIATIAGQGYRFTLEVADAAPPPAEGAGSATSDEVLAVLPLENLSGAAAEEYFADGMTESLITDLAKLGGLKVISRGSVMGFRRARGPLKEVAAALGASVVVEGSVLRAGDRVRIAVRLVRAATDACLWAERYDRELADVLALQDEVARAIAGSIDRTLRPAPARPPRRVDPEVYLLDLRGRHHWHQRTEAGFRAALAAFEEAVARDPTYAPGHVGIAESLNMLANYGFVPPPQVLPRSMAAVQRALELDEASSDAHRVLAFAEWQFRFAWERAIAAYERALALSPNSPGATYWFGVCLAVVGHFERAHRMLLRAQELDPLSLVVPSVRGWAHVFARRHEEALPFFDAVLRIDPDFHVALWFQGEALVELQRHEAGIAALTRAYELGGRTARLLGYLGYALGRAGRTAEARACLAQLQARAAEGQYVPPYFRALVLSGLGDFERAEDALEEALVRGDTMLRDLKADPQWDRLHGRPRFDALMQRMAYPPPP